MLLLHKRKIFSAYNLSLSVVLAEILFCIKAGDFSALWVGWHFDVGGLTDDDTE